MTTPDDPLTVALRLAGDRKTKVADMAKAYANCIREDSTGVGDLWVELNGQILDTWGRARLVSVKNLAWKIVQGRAAAPERAQASGEQA